MWNADDKGKFIIRFAEFAELMGEPMSPARIVNYCAALERTVSVDQALAALDRAAESCRFFPKPADLREIVAELHEEGTRAYERRVGRFYFCETCPPDPWGHPTKHAGHPSQGCVSHLGPCYKCFCGPNGTTSYHNGPDPNWCPERKISRWDQMKKDGFPAAYIQEVMGKSAGGQP